MNPRLVRCLVLLTLLLVAPLGASLAAPSGATSPFPMRLAPGVKPTQFTLPKISEAGCIIARVEAWTGKTSLTLTIRGGRQSSQPATANQGPLWVSYPVSADQRSQSWVVEALRGSGGDTLSGTLFVEYPPTQVPCQLAAKVNGRNVTMTWTYNGQPGSFLVERSSDRKAWTNVCTQKSSVSASCSETLSKGGTYWYRACWVSSGSRCASSNVTPPLRATVR